MYIGLDIGGTKCSVVLADERAAILRKIKFPTVDCVGTLKKIIESITLVFEPGVRAIGISCGGPLDLIKGCIMSPPNLPDWNHIEIVRLLSEKFQRPVFLKNDADACALAEWKFGNARGASHVVFLTFGTGFGAGLILNGRLYTGACGQAGEIGHVRLYPCGHLGYGKEGAVEGYCSGGGIEQYKMGTARELAEKARRGDLDAIAVFKEVGANLGKVLAILTDILNPQIIVIGSIYTRVEQFLKPSLLEQLRAEALSANFESVKIRPAGLGENLGDMAAVCAAMDGLGLEEDKICIKTRE